MADVHTHWVPASVATAGTVALWRQSTARPAIEGGETSCQGKLSSRAVSVIIRRD